METLNKNILVALLDLAQSDVPASVQALADELNMSRREVAEDLNLLAAEGLVNPKTVRLSFVGLMHAAGLRAKMQKHKADSSRAA